MFKASHYRLLFVVVVIVALAAPSAFATHRWGTYHWNKPGSSVAIVIGDNVSGTWDTYLRNAESEWDVAPALNLSVGAGQGTSCTMRAGRVEVCARAYGANGWLGLAQISVSGSHITGATAKMNTSYSMYESEKRHVMCQEVGHAWGLGHTSENGSSQNTCMDYYQNTSNSDMTSTQPNSHDYSMLATIYNHSGATTPATLAMIPPAFGYLDFSGPVETLGEEIFRTEDGRGRVYLLDFGTDHEGEELGLLTHVYMAGDNNPLVETLERERPWLRGINE